MAERTVSSGLAPLDRLVEGLRLGDNVVWQVDNLPQYVRFAEAFAERAVQDGRPCYYLRFAPHPPVLQPRPHVTVVELDPAPGFDRFSAAVHRTIAGYGKGAFYVFDNLSALVAEWATDELLANFFQATCPFLFELDTVAYFALNRGQHAHSAVARIRDTTQLLLDVYQVRDELYVHPLKVWDRYSPQMFVPHLVRGEDWRPVWGSGEAAAAAGAVRGTPLRQTAGSVAPWESVYRKLRQHLDTVPAAAATPEISALRQELLHMLIGSQAQFERLAEKYLTLEDLVSVRERLIGSGRIGGKATGMLLARRILLQDPGTHNFAEVLEAHDSFYIGSDVFFSFLVHNDLFRLRMQLARNETFTREEFEAVEQRFLAGRFGPEVFEQFRSVLDYFGQAPIIVRSSSLLEDNFGNAFAGKYHSEFCANQGTPDERMAAFLNAVKLVYASALNPDALSYRRRHGLTDHDEQMAILVQRVSGCAYRQFFLPPLAGVGFSRNLYAWTDRIDARQGMVRLVLGLGTHAVNRVGGDYPRMIALSHPLLRPEVGAAAAKYSQREVDLLDLRANELQTRYLADVVDPQDFPHLHLFVSELRDGGLYDPTGRFLEAPASNLVLTFNNLLRQTELPAILREALAKLERAYGQPVDTEFTARVTPEGRIQVNMLQCRPLRLPGTLEPLAVPRDLPAGRTLFRASRTISGGVVRHLRFILYIDPRAYAEMDSLERKKALGRVVGRVNALPQVQEGRVLMMGPGRWGSSNIDLGVNVRYADIHNAAVLVELAREEAGHVPEVSYGTHFFQDLVEAQIIYLPVYPDDPEAQFNAGFFQDLPNCLGRMLPDCAEFEPWVRVLDVPAVAGGARAHVIADPQSQEALCYLSPP